MKISIYLIQNDMKSYDKSTHDIYLRCVIVFKVSDIKFNLKILRES